MTAINPDKIWVLSALDKFMGDYKSQPQMFNALFQQKKTIIQLLQSMKIDSKKYKAIVVKAYKQESGDVKKCAESDILKCKDAKNQEMVELWFREMIENTGIPYEDQEKQYQLNKGNKIVAPKPNNSVVKQAESGSNNQDISSLISFKSIDNLLDQNAHNKDYYSKLLQRKQKLIGLVKSKALTPEKYKATLQLYMSKTTNEDTISDYKFELDGVQDFHDGNVAAWFKQIYQQTVQKLEEQLQKLNSRKQTIQKKKPAQKEQIDDLQSEQEQQINKNKAPKTTTSFNISEINSFKVFDQILQELVDKQQYRQILNKKKKFLQYRKKGEITPQKYKAMLIAEIKKATNQQIKQKMEFQLSQLSDFHENNEAKWLEDIVSTSEMLLQDQQATLAKLQKGQKMIKRKDDDDEDINISDDDEQIQPEPQEKKVKPKPKEEQPAQQKKPIQPQTNNKAGKISKLGVNSNQIYSLKALDEFMQQFSKDQQTFCLCFQRKQQIFQMMKNGQITPKKYKQLQQTCLKSSNNDKLKEAAEMDLFDLKDICDNNVDQWFQTLVNDSGDNYAEQQEIYNKIKGSKAEKGGKSQQKAFIKPAINEVICFTAVSLLFEYCQKSNDFLYYNELLTKRQRILQLVTQKRLIPTKYREINKTTAAKTDNQFLKQSIAQEEQRLATQFGGKEQEWFKQILKSVTKDPPSIKMPENQEMKKVNGWSADKKKTYLLSRMAEYQSLSRYYRDNQMSTKNNKYIQQYQKYSKQQAEKAIQQIQKHPEIDIYSIASLLFPPINQKIFYGDALAELRQRTEKASQLIQREIAAIKEYAGKIKKATNPQNLQDCRKQIAKCEQNIKYLRSWPNGELIGFPRFKDEKIQKYNLDIVRYLERNEIQVQVTGISGVQPKNILKIFVVDSINARFYSEIHQGMQTEIKTIVKLSVKDMIEIYRGEKKLIWFRIYQKGFFGKLTMVGENAVETSFIRSNIIEERVQVGHSLLSYALRVQRPTKPLTTEITHYQLKPLPIFEPNPKIEEELIKKYKSKIN